jgi:putative tricarboxylic transport membrane protein
VAWADRILGIALIVLAAFYYWLSFDIEIGFASDRIGPQAFPRGLAVLLGIASLALVARSFGRGASASGPAATEGERLDRLYWTLGLLLVYLIAMPRVGFLLATPPFLAAFTLLYGYRRWVPLVATALGTTIALHLVFARLLGVRLPTGVLG